MSTNLYKIAKLVKYFYFCRIPFLQSLTFYAYLTLRVDYSHLFVFLFSDALHFRLNKKISLPLAAKGRFFCTKLLFLLFVVRIPVLQSESFSFVFPKFVFVRVILLEVIEFF